MFLLQLLFLSVIIKQGYSDVVIDIGSYDPVNKTSHTFEIMVPLTKMKTNLTVTNITDNVGFLIVQVHSFSINVTLSENTGLNGSVTGRNVGLVYASDNSTVTYTITVDPKSHETNVLVVIQIYNELDPVPGGCNLSFFTEVAPYQLVSFTEDLITVKSQPPSGYAVSCDDNKIQVDMYHMFLSAFDNDPQSYYNGIRSMLTHDRILTNGNKITPLEGSYKYKRFFSAYSGVGEVFAIVATYKNRSSVYVPAVSYACNISNWEYSCVGPVSEHSKFFCALVLLIGLFLCTFGNTYYKFSQIFAGLIFAALTTYCLLTLDPHFSYEERATTSIILAGFLVIIWSLAEYKWQISVYVNLMFILCGELVASLCFYTIFADMPLFINNVNYWVTFCCIVVMTLMICFANEAFGNYTSKIIGFYCIILAFNYYIGGNLQYVLINVVRRATVKNFNLAVIDPPFQALDIAVVAAWGVFVLSGIMTHFASTYLSCPWKKRNPERTERSPLLQDQEQNHRSFYYV